MVSPYTRKTVLVLLFPFERQGSSSLEKSKGLPKVTQQVSLWTNRWLVEIQKPGFQSTEFFVRHKTGKRLHHLPPRLHDHERHQSPPRTKAVPSCGPGHRSPSAQHSCRPPSSNDVGDKHAYLLPILLTLFFLFLLTLLR